MGGVAGHLSHLQENLDFTFGDIKAVLKDVASGEMEAIEKVDGQNIFFTYDVNTGTVKTARNSGDIKRGGMSPQELTAKFTGHPAEGAFIGGFKAIESALQGLSEEELADIFGEEADTYVNAEIMYPANPNIINYNGSYIVMHGAQYFGDDPDAEPTNTKNSFAKLLNAVESAEKQGDKSDWQVMGPQVVALQNIMDGSTYGDFVTALDAAAPGSSDGMTLGEYVKERLYEGPVGRLPISQHQQDELVKLIMGDEDAPTLRQFKKGMPKDLHKLISQLATKANRYKVISTMLLPIERVISDFAIEVLRGMGSLFVSDHDTEIQRMRKEVESSITAIQSAQGSDIEALQSALDKQLAKLGPIENIASTMEGIVFEYPPGSEQLYKLTGAFAMVNQIIGGARRMPKKEDMGEGLLRDFIMMLEGPEKSNAGVTLRTVIQEILIESKASDAFEDAVATAINSSGKNIKATRPSVGTQYSDVYVTVKDLGAAWVEVKMSHSDNLSNPRMFYDGTTWVTTYKTPTAKYAVNLLNESTEAKQFIKEITEFSGIKNPILPTTKGGLRDPNAVPLEVMREFVELRGGRYIATETDVNIGALVTQHYTVGKAEPASYMQSGGDFYLIGSLDPFGLQASNEVSIPRLGGTGDFKIRVATRSSFYEIQAEIKIKKFRPASSEFSVFKGTGKINPFDAISKK
jgi:hypothetical protein